MNIPQKVQELKDQGHKVFSYTTESEEVFYFRKPNKTDILYFQNDIANNSNSTLTSAEKMVRKLFCGENTESFSKFLEEKPLAISNLLEYAIKDMLDTNFTVNDI